MVQLSILIYFVVIETQQSRQYQTISINEIMLAPTHKPRIPPILDKKLILKTEVITTIRDQLLHYSKQAFTK